MSDFPIPSKTYVNKCGDIIRKGNIETFEYQNAFKVISDWRNLHSQPLNKVRALIKIRLNRLGFKKLIIGQRLKRMPSIIEKLNRFGGIELSRMQDIGGLRIVVPTIDDIKKVHDRLLRKNSTLSLSNEKDYINTDGPKDDGYRSVHMIFKYKSKKHPGPRRLVRPRNPFPQPAVRRPAAARRSRPRFGDGAVGTVVR